MPDPHDGPVKDRRRPPFCYQTHAALDAIRARLEGARLSTALAVYLALTEAANRNGGASARDGFTAERREIAALAGVTLPTLDKYVPELVRAGVLTVEKRKEGNANLPSRWVLVEPVSGAPPGKAACPPPESGLANRAHERWGEPKKDQQEGEPAAPSPAVAEEPPPLRLVDGQNVGLNSLAEVCGYDTDNKRDVGELVVALNGNTRTRPPTQGIREQFWIELVRWSETRGGVPMLVAALTADQFRFEHGLAEAIRRKADLYRSKYAGATLTAGALCKHWLRLERQPERRDGGLTPGQIARGEW